MKWKAFVTEKINEIDIRITHTTPNKNNETTNNEPHIHSECEVYINLSGGASFEVENNIYPIKRGSVILTKPYEYHRGTCVSDADHEYYWVTFTADENEEFLDIFFDRNKGENNLIQLEEEDLLKIIDIFEDVLDSPSDKLKKQLTVLTFFSILRKGVSISADQHNAAVPPDILKALAFMDQHATENITVKDIAESVNQSVNTLERRFRKTLNTTPTKSLTQKRLLLSQDFLRAGDTVTEAAIKCGISDYSNYIQLFRKHFKMTPLHYKKQFKK